MKDWQDKVSDEEVHCPMCGHIASADKWWTQDQLAKMQEIAKSWAMSYAQQTLDKSFRDLERSTRHNKFIRITYKPGRRVTFANNPIGQREEWETEICCEKCGTHYSVIGSAYFCPCCGYNSAINSFNDSLDNIRKMLDSLQEMRAMFAEKYNDDSAETMCRSLLESSIGDMISAYQKFACCIYEELSGKSARVNDFQMVDKGSQLIEEATGKKYSDWLLTSEMSFMTIMFQKRHLLEHNNGMIDQKYIDRSGDTAYSVGQRLIIKSSDAYCLLDVLRKLANELIGLQKASGKNASN